MHKLGVNVDHVATLRQARKGIFPDPAYAAFLCEEAGADSIVAHLREDRRHIQDRDVENLRKKIRTKFNLEMSVSPEIVRIACKIKPDQATLVPERRQELTTEGGLDAAANLRRIRSVVLKLRDSGVRASLFIDPDKKQIDAASSSGAGIIELHTGRYAAAESGFQKEKYFNQICRAVDYACKKGLLVNVGHGLDYKNVSRLARIGGIEEFNIGYSIICKSLYTGLYEAVKEMKRLIG